VAAPEATVDPRIRVSKLGGGRTLLPLVLGGSWYDRSADDSDLIAAMAAAYDNGVRQFDTGARYSGGHSEELVGAFVCDKRGDIFLSSKSDTKELTADAMLAEVEGSLRRLGVDRIDLYYIHWPRAGRDMRPTMEGLVRAKEAGKIGAIGVSNFDAEQMRQVEEVADIAAHQLGYNLLWRHRGDDVIPYCRERGIAVVAYSALAHGILAGKFGRDPKLAPGDQRHTILPFRPDIWPDVYAAVEDLKAVATSAGLPLATLAVRWLLAQPGIDSVVIGARNGTQAKANAQVLRPAVPEAALAQVSVISDRISRRIPDVGNVFDHYP
jgi:aryl-alcohol dehydrogenase-like predicted oxidoreductase